MENERLAIYQQFNPPMRFVFMTLIFLMQLVIKITHSECHYF